MSWSIFRTRCLALTGRQHVKPPQFARTVANAYHQSVIRHLDTVTGGGRVLGTTPAPLYAGLLKVMYQNLNSNSKAVSLISQLQPYIYAYWAPAFIVGRIGVVKITGTGKYTGLYVAQNFDFNIILNHMIYTFAIHMKTLTGIYTSTALPSVTTPWSGAALVSLV